jgi:PAS domain S-box-containing protein
MNAPLSVYCTGEVGIDPGRLGGSDDRFTVRTVPPEAASALAGRGEVDCFVVGGVVDLDALVTGVRVADRDVPVVVVADRAPEDLPEEVTAVVAPSPPGAVDRLREAVLSAVTDYWRPDEVAVRDLALDAAPIGVTISDPSKPDNPMVYVNEQFEAITGYDEQEVIGRNCRLLQGPDTDEEPVRTMREAVEAEVPTMVELRNYRKDGEPFRNRVKIIPVRNDAGETTHFLGLQRDVTERYYREHRAERVREGRRAVRAAVADPDCTGEALVDRLLSAGREALGTANAHLGRTDRGVDRREVVRSVGSELVAAGDVQALSETVCQETLDRETAVAFHDPAVAGEAAGSAAREWGVGCYLGATVERDGDPYGTLCFLDERPREAPFSEGERTLAALLAAEVGRQLPLADAAVSEP